MSEQEINDYCELDTIYDKAGAYAIQNEAKEFITSIDGDYYNVVGFPVEEVKKHLK
jgi:septum formation protein